MPSSYRPATVGDQSRNANSSSQSVSSNIATDKRTVRQLLSNKDSGVITIRPDARLADAVKMLKEKRIGALVVADDSGALRGILSERDIVRKLADTPGQTLPQRVADNMTSEVKTCSPDDTLIEVLKQMTEGRFRHLPVLEGGNLIGMITIGDVVNDRLKELEYEALQLKQMIVG